MKWMLALLVVLVSSPVLGQYDKPLSPSDEKKNIAKLIKNHSAAKSAFAKNPKNPTLKKAYVLSNVSLGLQYTYAGTVDRKEKYKIALRYFREALRHDPKNKDARQTHDQIVSIYKSMGRPVPGDSGKG